ncbi:hypothetical protein IP86_17255 [Rhodopseudomonas sp. AAP120]|uniref:OpgC domain-containing protein n=1 Tax=Rhodopseudomonas TaxID=1073 RepID=UPI000164BE36|nr:MULTISPECIES: OpgC domain-containing protein [Rhodopseudomonas]ACE99616.1 putative membrane protein of unknown function [Rhodopseudomonas palustris TIE-1]KPF96174.1 hypothetical protein IP86_17255 [Rhodopseudomonas sp. AAP120]
MPLFGPPPARDLRLDLFRGLANWAIFFGHIPGTALAWLTSRNYGFSDGADLFVFISGYTTALVFGRMMAQRGFLIGATRLLKRVWQLYVAYVLLFIFYLTSVHYLAHRFDIGHLMDQFNVARLMEFPVETLAEGLMLKFKPLNLDVLPLYIVLMAAFVPILWLMLRHRNWALAGSLLLYLAARAFHWNLPSYPSGGWFFNPFTWQLLFVLGAWFAAGGARDVRAIVTARTALVVSVGFVLFALVATLATLIPAMDVPIVSQLTQAFRPNDKTNLAPYRVLHLMALALLAVRFIPIDWPGLRWPIFRPLITCGQQSLEVFCVGVFLAFIAHFVLETTSQSFFAQLLVGAAGLSVMTGVAYYRSWSKQIDKAPITTAKRPPATQSSQLPPQEVAADQTTSNEMRGNAS